VGGGGIAVNPGGAKDKMGHAYFMLDTEGYKHTLRICNIYCFSTATMVAEERLNLAL